MSSNLLPCPFCGSTNLRHEFSGSQGYIECNECGTQGPCDERAADPICDQDAGCAAWNRRAADRAQRHPVPPEPGEVQELVKWLRELGAKRGGVFDVSTFCANLTRAAELLSQRHPQPVPVSERPWEREGWCDEQGRCWLCGKVEGDWRFLSPTNSGLPHLKYGFTHCLPAHALPLPGEVER